VKGKLLIIDDEQVYCEMLKRHFEDKYAITDFTDPEEAVEYFKENCIDVVLTDLSMPKLDGLDILKIVKTESILADVIIMTAFATVDNALKAMKQGACDYITKPFSIDELEIMLSSIFEKRRSLEESISPGDLASCEKPLERALHFIDRKCEEREADGFSYSDAKKNTLNIFNISIINRTLLRYNGNVKRAAEKLELDRANFQRLMRRYRIVSDEFKKQS
jgi:DNA-binding NtrC family response regulator